MIVLVGAQIPFDEGRVFKLRLHIHQESCLTGIGTDPLLNGGQITGFKGNEPRGPAGRNERDQREGDVELKVEIA
jgi:hypothetical protein